jgi:hypothetical protein
MPVLVFADPGHGGDRDEHHEHSGQEINGSTDSAVTITPDTDILTPQKNVTWSWSFPDDLSATFRYYVDKNASWTARGWFGSRTSVTKRGDGVYYVHVQARDSAGNVSAVYSKGLLLDKTAPRIASHADIVATPAGDTTVVTYTTPTATDNIDTPASVPVVVSCSSSDNLDMVPVQGSFTFANGRHYVICTATDRAGNTGQSHFRVTVQDRNNPSITLNFTGPVATSSPNPVFEATNSNGVQVNYTTTWNPPLDNDHDEDDQTPDEIVCSPASGSAFSIASTPIICTANVSHYRIFQETPAVVVVQDTTRPVITLAHSNPSIQVGGDASESNLRTLFGPSVSSAVGVDDNGIVIDLSSVVSGVAGSYPVYFSACDLQAVCTDPAVTGTLTVTTVVVPASAPLGGGAPGGAIGFGTGGGGAGGGGYVWQQYQSSFGNVGSSQTANVSGGTGGGGGSVGFQFTVPLTVGVGGDTVPAKGSSGGPGAGGTVKGATSVGAVGEQVRQLQIFLNKHGFVIAKKGSGSPGKESNYFGPATAVALKKFQEANAKVVLAPVGLKKGTGVFGPTTIKFVNSLLKAGK